MEPSSGEDGNFLSVFNTQCCYWLQWSRPQVRTETIPGTTVLDDAISASMEPSSGEDGNMSPAMRAKVSASFNGAVLR